MSEAAAAAASAASSAAAAAAAAALFRVSSKLWMADSSDAELLPDGGRKWRNKMEDQDGGTI